MAIVELAHGRGSPRILVLLLDLKRLQHDSVVLGLQGGEEGRDGRLVGRSRGQRGRLCEIRCCSYHFASPTLTGLDIDQVLFRQGLSGDRIRAILVCGSANVPNQVRPGCIPIYLSINAFSYTVPEVLETTGTVGGDPETGVSDLFLDWLNIHDSLAQKNILSRVLRW